MGQARRLVHTEFTMWTEHGLVPHMHERRNVGDNTERDERMRTEGKHDTQYKRNTFSVLNHLDCSTAIWGSHPVCRTAREPSSEILLSQISYLQGGLRSILELLLQWDMPFNV